MSGSSWGSQMSTEMEDITSSIDILPPVREGVKSEFADIKEENATLKDDYLRQTVDIVIAAIPTVPEHCFMCFFISLGKMYLQGSVSTNVFELMRPQLDFRNLGVGI
jgi:hypothetical protein